MEFDVKDIHCLSCAEKIQKAIKAVQPGATVTVDSDSGRVVVEPGGDSAAIVMAIQTAGYSLQGAHAQQA